MDKVMDYVFVTNVIPPEVCADVIQQIHDKPWETHSWYNYEGNQYSSQKDKELDVLNTNQTLQDLLGEFVYRALQEYMVKYGKQTDDRIKSFVRTFTPIRFNRYRPGTLMREHYDHIHSIFDGQRKGIPILTILGVLNDDYEGGEFHFPGLDSVALRAGDILLFPSNFMYPHEVKEVTNGVRYTFVAWAF